MKTIHIRKALDIKEGDYVFTHGNGIITYIQRIESIVDDGKAVILGVNEYAHKINKTGLLAIVIKGNESSAPVGALVNNVKAALNDYGRLKVKTWSDVAMELRN